MLHAAILLVMLRRGGHDVVARFVVALKPNVMPTPLERLFQDYAHTVLPSTTDFDPVYPEALARLIELTTARRLGRRFLTGTHEDLKACPEWGNVAAIDLNSGSSVHQRAGPE